MNLRCSICGALHWKAEKSSGTLRNPLFGICCNSGRTQISHLQTPPAILQRLYDSNDIVARNFQEYIWQYNRAFSFTSLSVKQDHSVNENRRGPPVFRIQGELFHRLGSIVPTAVRQDNGSLVPIQQHRATYAQLYIYEPHISLNKCMINNPTLRRNIMSEIQKMLLRHHPYSHIYSHAYQVLQRYPSNVDIAICIRATPGIHQRSGNVPTANEVAVIMPGDTSEGDQRDILL
jgi:hypothetical protein